MWEFAGDPAHDDYLGYSTSGPAIVRVGTSNKRKVVRGFRLRPTGPVDPGVKQFMGASNQHLKLFVVDLATGELVTTIDT